MTHRTSKPTTHADCKRWPIQVLVNETDGAVSALYFGFERDAWAFYDTCPDKVRGIFRYTNTKPWGYFVPVNERKYWFTYTGTRGEHADVLVHKSEGAAEFHYNASRTLGGNYNTIGVSTREATPDEFVDALRRSGKFASVEIANALRKIAYAPFGHAEATDREVLDAITTHAREVLAEYDDR